MNQMAGQGNFNNSEVPPDVQTRRLRQQLGEDTFVAHVIEQNNGQTMYEALMRIPHYSTAARDRLLDAIAKSGDVDAICLTHVAYKKGMPQKARAALIAAIVASNDPKGAYNLLCGKHQLPTVQRKQLLKIVVRDPFYAGCTHDYSKQVTQEERIVLLDATA